MTGAGAGPGAPRGARALRLAPAAVFFVLVAAAIGALPEYPVVLLAYVGLNALVALGLVLLTGVGGLTSFGQAAFVGVGAYATAVASVQFGLSPWLGLPIGLALTAAVALVLGWLTLRLSGHYLALGTIAWGIGRWRSVSSRACASSRPG